MSGKYFADDRFIISDEVKNMSKEERKREIARLENEIKDRKRNMQKKELTRRRNCIILSGGGSFSAMENVLKRKYMQIR